METADAPVFAPFPKISRLSREVIITEKIDGTNAQINISENGTIVVGSRNRIITTLADNFGFASWVEANRDDLLNLGPGRHYGEWWGPGIQRGYGIREKRFSLFNVGRWNAQNPAPACCHVVPVLDRHTFSTCRVEEVLTHLTMNGSVASPGFMRPEGIVIFHTHSGQLFKKTIENDQHGKEQRG